MDRQWCAQLGCRDGNMRQISEPSPSSVYWTIRDIVDDMQNESGAAIVSLYLYDDESETYYAPFAKGIPETGSLGSILDMRDQLARYRSDAAQGKAPSDLQLKHYGPNVWLTVTQRPFYTRDAPTDIDSSFIRRHQIQSVLGLPLLHGDTLVGLLYLDFLGPVVPGSETSSGLTPDQMASLERHAANAARAIDRARSAEERAATTAIGRLAAHLSAMPEGGGHDGARFRNRLNGALDLFRETVGFEAVAVYEFGARRNHLELVSAQGLPNPPSTIEIPIDVALGMGSSGDLVDSEAVQRGFLSTGFRLVATFPLRMQERLHGYLVILGEDQLAFHRRAVSTRLHWQTIADVIAGGLVTARLYEEVKRHADQLEITSDVSKAIASSIDLDQTLRLVARNMVRLIDASLCQIALYEEDGSAWYGAAASDDEEAWRRQRGERPASSFLFDVLDRAAPLVVEDVANSELINPHYARVFGIQSLLALPLFADDQPIGAVVLAQRDRIRSFTADEVQRTHGLAHQAAIALKNARLHGLSEEERHIQKDVVLLGFGQWAQKAYEHLLTLKQFYNFKTHVVAPDRGEAKRAAMASLVKQVIENGDTFYWDSPTAPAREQLRRQLESSCYVISYVVTPAATHLPVVAEYYDLSNVIVIEKPLGATPEAYRQFLDSVDGGVEIVAADHYYFKLEVRLLQTLLTEEKTLKAFLDSVEEIEIELLEEKPLTGAAAEIGIIADMIPHAFAIASLLTPIDRIQLTSDTTPLAIGRQEPAQSEKETYARLTASFPHRGRSVRLVIVTGKGVENSKWIKLSGEQRVGGRRAFYKFDFGKGVAIDGTQTNLRAAVRTIREAGVPDTAHLSMLRHILDKRHPAVGILAIREAIRSNQRIQEIEVIASDLLARGEWTPYQQGQRPDLGKPRQLHVASEPIRENGVARLA